MILGTDFLIARDAEDTDALQKAAELEAVDVPLRVSTIAVQELYVGVGAGARSFENVRKYEALIANRYSTIPVGLADKHLHKE